MTRPDLDPIPESPAALEAARDAAQGANEERAYQIGEVLSAQAAVLRGFAQAVDGVADEPQTRPELTAGLKVAATIANQTADAIEQAS